MSVPANFDVSLATVVPAGRIERNAPLASLTTFGVGGPADWLLDVRSIEELVAIIRLARDHDVPVTVLGGGSNVVIADDGLRGVVLRLRLQGISAPSPDRVRAEAGVTINGLVRWTVGHGLAGIEKWAGTPGTVGGAIHGNAHFGGVNISELVLQVMLVAETGDMRVVQRDEMGFGYDCSRLQHSREILVWADFAVAPGDTDVLRRTARDSLAFRKRTQPLAMPSAGCLFQNPDAARDVLPAGIPASAGALIDRAGLKGARQGDARISPTHANFLVNEGQATAQDIRTLAERARTAVRDQFGVELRDEVVWLGFA
jgi:UDP-N-acetylmuramate dehydrogenase